MIQPLISCVVPSFNSSRYIGEALDSILKQSYRPLEVIVADDGSTDDTEPVVTSYGSKVKFSRQETAGPAETRNFGLKQSVGDFIAFLDADDLWHPEKLTKQSACFTANPEIDMCVSFTQMFWPDSLIGEKEKYENHRRAKPIPGYATTTLLAKRQVFDTIGNFDQTYWFGDATDWFVRARDHGLNIFMLEEVLTFHRMHESNLTKRRSEESKDEFLRLVKKSLERRRGQFQV